MLLDTYRPSGFFRPTVIVYFVIAAVAGVMTAWLYQFLARWIPFIYINIILCGGFGALVGGFGALAIKQGHCRNPILATVLALPLIGASLAATYYWDYRSVVSKVADETKRSVDEIKQELPMRDYVALKQRVGWKVKSSKMDGVFVLIVWGVEALLISGIGLWLTVGAAREPYCERCNGWCQSHQVAVPGRGAADATPLLDRGD